MAKKGDKRKIIGLVGVKSGKRLYYTSKNSQNTPEPLVLRKFNSQLREIREDGTIKIGGVEEFKETKKNLGRNEVKGRK